MSHANVAMFLVEELGRRGRGNPLVFISQWRCSGARAEFIIPANLIRIGQCQHLLIAALGSSLRHDDWEGSGAFNASVWGGLRGLPLFLFLPVR